MSNHVTRERYQTAREALERYRGALQSAVWFVLLIIPAGVVLMLIGFSHSGAVVTLMFAGVCVSLYFQHRANQVDELKPFLCECEGYDDCAATAISNPWVCGYCAHVHPRFNSLPWRSTLVDPCKNCNRRQHSVLCWRCDKPIIWDEDTFRNSQKRSAWHPDFPPSPPAPEEPKVQERRPPRFIEEDFS
jgi:hypothetical protein